MMRRLYTPPSANRSSCQRSRWASSFWPLHHQIGTGEKLRGGSSKRWSSSDTLLYLPSSCLLWPCRVDAQGTGKADVTRRGSHIHQVAAARYLPAVRVDVPVGKRPRGGVRVQRHAHLLRLTWHQLDLRPTYQPLRWFLCACRQSEVDLRDFCSCPLAGIRDREAYLYRYGATIHLR